jgi:hypothetical protein
MANRNFAMQQFTLEKQVVTLYAQWIGTGAANPTPVRQKGVAPASGGGPLSLALGATRTGIGLWTVQLADPYYYLFSLDVASIQSTAKPPSVLSASIVSAVAGTPQPVGIIPATGIPQSINIALYSATGALADLATGDILTLVFELSNSGAA